MSTSTDNPTAATSSIFAGLAVLWIKWRSSFDLALRSLWLHKLRSILSVLGIIIGTGSVIAIMAVGKGNMEDALEDIRRQGTNNVIVRSIKPLEVSSTQRSTWVAKYGLTWDDFKRFNMIPTVKSQVPMRIFPQEVRRLERVVNARLVATTEEYAKINRFDMAVGRFLVDGEDQADEGDAQRYRNVIVLGSRVAEDLFPFEEVVGQAVVINKNHYLVVGVIKDRMPRGQSGGEAQEDYNRDVYIPIRTCMVRFGERVMIRQGSSRTGESVELHQITLTIDDMDKVRITGDVVVEQLKRNHTKKDWEVAVPLDRLKEAEDARDRGMWLLVLIAAISLVVGGIGIMNIMLATVTERTREIGIRRALGAKRRDIVMQFMIEATVQTVLGGLLGTAAGLALVFGIPWISGFFLKKPVPLQLEGYSILISISASVLVGVVAGLYPAIRASRLDPIEALRHN
jgi:putative ABC transport system permease protein